MVKYSSWDGFTTRRQAEKEEEGEGEGEGLNAWFGLLRRVLVSVPREVVLPHAHWQNFRLTLEGENQVFKLLVAQRILPPGCILQTLRVALGLPYRPLKIEAGRNVGAQTERINLNP